MKAVCDGTGDILELGTHRQVTGLKKAKVTVKNPSIAFFGKAVSMAIPGIGDFVVVIKDENAAEKIFNKLMGDSFEIDFNRIQDVAIVEQKAIDA